MDLLGDEEVVEYVGMLWKLGLPARLTSYFLSPGKNNDIQASKGSLSSLKKTAPSQKFCERFVSLAFNNKYHIRLCVFLSVAKKTKTILQPFSTAFDKTFAL